MDVRELVKRLGGASRVAERCGVTPPAVSNWCARGAVASEHHLAVWQLAVEAGVDWRPPGAEGLSLVVEHAA